MNTKALSEQAVALQRSGKLAEAERLYLQALAQDPHDFTSRHFLGVTRATSQPRLRFAPTMPKLISTTPMCLRAWAGWRRRWPASTAP
jgi:hypothetical protein